MLSHLHPNMPSRGRRDLTKYSNQFLPIITQGYSFKKLQSFLEQNDFASKLVILENQTFRYIIELKFTKSTKVWTNFKKWKIYLIFIRIFNF